ncbi:MAG: ATPase domain-containing protein [Candidatus Burarchaeum sp.]|nr:ATPase domain-containing protein [Candidatus Burarchaeum sp.]MDO8339750.1 ATPase domain-containing protein [Candidatus Burarchaeum sp.]
MASAAKDRVQTGIPGLDSMIGGGFERGSAVVVAGDAGSGKTTFAMQFLHYGAKKLGECGLYITFEEQKESLFAHMEKFGLNFDELEKKGLVHVLEYPPHEVDRFVSEGGVIEDMIKDGNIKRVVVDSITSLVLLHENEYKRRQSFLMTLEALKKWGCTSLLTSEARTVGGEVRSRFGIDYLADGMLAIHAVRRVDERDLAFEILKLRGIAHERKMCPLKITEKGVMLFPGQPVFTGTK